MSQARAAHLLRRILFHEPPLRTIASMVMNHWAQHTQAQAEERLRQLRTELKSLAHASQAGLVLATDPNQKATPQPPAIIEGPERPMDIPTLREVQRDAKQLRRAQDAGLVLPYDEADIVRRAHQAGFKPPDPSKPQ